MFDTPADALYTRQVLEGVAEFFEVPEAELRRGPGSSSRAPLARAFAVYFLRARTARTAPLSWNTIAELLGQSRQECLDDWNRVEQLPEGRTLTPAVAVAIAPVLSRVLPKAEAGHLPR